MSQSSPPPGPTPPIRVPIRAPVELGLAVAGITLFIVLVSVFAGLWLDGLFGTKPIITVILVIGSAPVALTLTYRVAMRAIQGQGRPGGSSSGNIHSSKEED